MAVTQEHIKKAVSIAKEYGAHRVVLFGSALENPDAAHDLDLAVEGVSGWEFYGFVADLNGKLGITVDVVPIDTIEENHITREIRTYGKVIYDGSPQDVAYES